MTLKQKLLWLVPSGPLFMDSYNGQKKSHFIGGVTNCLYSLALLTFLTMYTILGLQFKTFNAKKQLERFVQEAQEIKIRDASQAKLFNYVDKNKDGMIEVSEFNDFCEKTKNSDLSNKILVDYYNNGHNIWESVDLEKAIKIYLGENEKIK